MVRELTGVNNITASEAAKSHGLKTLTEIARLSGVPRRTLYDWYNDKSELFEVVCLGCRVKKDKMTLKMVK